MSPPKINALSYPAKRRSFYQFVFLAAAAITNTQRCLDVYQIEHYY